MANERNIDVRIRLKGADQFKSGMKNVNASLSTMGGWLDVTKGLLGSALIQKGLSVIVNGLKDCVDESVNFESALAGVAKTTDFSDVGLKNFGNQLIKLSEQIPMSAADLAGLAEVAGQLGIAEDDLLSFTEVVAAMGVSTNMSAEEAATAFARIANIFGTSSDDYSKLGSVVVDLGNNFATTESEIVSMAQNMSGMAALVGMTEANVMGFATALSSIGIHSEAGGSAMQKLFQLIEKTVHAGGENLNLLAQTASLTGEEFQRMWTSDPAKAVEAFTSGLGLVEKHGESALDVMASLGIREVRLTRAVLGLANAEGLLANAMDTANIAWAENSALAEEAGKRYKTTASRMEIAQNKIDNAQITVGDSLSGVVLGVKDTIGTIAAEWNEKAREIDLAEIVESANEAYLGQRKIIDDTAKHARQLVDAIAAMGPVENLDVAGQKEYIATMDAIIALVPEANKLWNKETLSIEGGTAAIHRNIDAALALADAEARLNRDRESVDAYNILEQNLQAQRTQLALAEAEMNTIASDFENFQKGIDTTGAPDITASQHVVEYKARLQEAEQNVKDISEEISKSEAALAEYAYVVDNFETSANDIVSASGEVADAVSGISAEQRTAIAGLEYLSDELTTVATAYEQAKDTILETINGAVSGFGAIEIPEIEGPESTVENLDSQIKFLNAYSDAVKKAAELGLDPEIIAQLSSGSEEDYATLASIVSGTEEDVALINAKYAEVAAAKETLAADLAAGVTDLSGEVVIITTLANDLVDGVDVGTDMYAKGANDIQKLIDGINSKVSTLASSARAVKNITSSMTDTGGETDGSHAAGLAYVPNDGYVAQLHRGEMVLTALEAKAYRAEQFANYAMPQLFARSGNGGNAYTSNVNTSVNVGTMEVRSDSDTRKIAENISRLNKRRANGRGYY